MTSFEPSILVNRLCISKGGRFVYDQRFEEGLNVVSGENSSGKTTIADSLFYGLGGDTPRWRQEVEACDYVYCEVLLNGQPATFRREISSERARPMAVFWGTLDSALVHSSSGWESYPYAATGTKQSFSEVIFRALQMPEVKSTPYSRVTMHQVLRLVYVDQRSDYESLFRVEAFDQQMTRSAVGDLLCGVYDDRLYGAELRAVELNSERLALQQEYKSIVQVLGPDSVLVEQVEQQKLDSQQRRAQAYKELRLLRETGSGASPAATEQRQQIGAALARANRSVAEARVRVEELRVTIDDRRSFIEALKRRINALGETEGMRSAFGPAVFNVCPSCYAPIRTVDEGICRLCKSPTDEANLGNILRIRTDLQRQLEQSEALQLEDISSTSELERHLGVAIVKQQKLQLAFDEMSGTAVTSTEVALGELNRMIGYYDRLLEELEHRDQLASRISQISERQAQLAAEVASLEDEVTTRRAAQESVRQDVYRSIQDTVLDILREDLPREVAFENARQVDFDFATNRLTVDGCSTFAASSNVYLKNAFHLGLLIASTAKEYMRYPRIAIFDNVEDKGMEPERSHRFQRIAREFSDTCDVSHQIFLFTSMPAPEFSGTGLVVGPHYTHERRTLDLSSSFPSRSDP